MNFLTYRPRVLPPVCLLLMLVTGVPPRAAEPDSGAATPPQSGADPQAENGEEVIVIQGRPVKMTVPPYNPATPPQALHQPAPVPTTHEGPLTLSTPPSLAD